MNFLEIIVFTIVFIIVLFYFGIQFYNTSKINNYIVISEVEDSLDYIKEIDRLCKVNILSCGLTYMILSIIYFYLTKHIAIFIGVVYFTVLFILCFIYYYAISIKVLKHKIRVYKAYNIINFIFNLVIILVSNVLLLLVLL